MSRRTRAQVAKLTTPARTSEAASDGSSSDSDCMLVEHVHSSALCVGATLLKKERTLRAYDVMSCSDSKILVHYVDSASLATGKLPLAILGEVVALEGFALANSSAAPTAMESGCMIWAHVERLLRSKPQGESSVELPGPGGVHQVKMGAAGLEVVTPHGKRICELEELARQLFEEGTRNLEEAMKVVRRRGEDKQHEERRGETPAREEADESRVEEGGDSNEGEEADESRVDEGGDVTEGEQVDESLVEEGGDANEGEEVDESLVKEGGDANEGEAAEESREDDALTIRYDGEHGDSDEEEGNSRSENGSEMDAGDEQNGEEMITGDEPIETELETRREDDAEMSIEGEDTDDAGDGGEEVGQDAGDDAREVAGGEDDGMDNEMITGDQPIETELETRHEDDAEMSTNDGEEADDAGDGGEDVGEDAVEDAGEDAREDGGEGDGEGDGEDDEEEDVEDDGEDDGEGEGEGEGEDDGEGEGEGEGESILEDAASQGLGVPNPGEPPEAGIEETLRQLKEEEEAKLNELRGCFTTLTSHSYTEPDAPITTGEDYDKLMSAMKDLKKCCFEKKRLALDKGNFNNAVEEYNTFHVTQMRERSMLLKRVEQEKRECTELLMLANQICKANAGYMESLPDDSDEIFKSEPLKAAKDLSAKLRCWDIEPMESRIERLGKIEKTANEFENKCTDELAKLRGEATTHCQEQEAKLSSEAEEGLLNLPRFINEYIGKSTKEHAATKVRVAHLEAKLERANETHRAYDTEFAKNTRTKAEAKLRECKHHLEVVERLDEQIYLHLNALKAALEEMVKSMKDSSRVLFDKGVQDGNKSRGCLDFNEHIQKIITFLDDLKSIATPRRAKRKWDFSISTFWPLA